MFLRFRGFKPSSLPSFCMLIDSRRFSEDCDMLRAFWAEPRIPSRLKLAWRWVLREVGDLRGDFMEPLPLVAIAFKDGVGISMEKFSLLGTANGLTVVVVVLVVVERGESPVDEGDMLARWGKPPGRGQAAEKTKKRAQDSIGGPRQGRCRSTASCPSGIVLLFEDGSEADPQPVGSAGDEELRFETESRQSRQSRQSSSPVG